MAHFALGDYGEFHFETFGEGFLECLYKHYPALRSLENRDDPEALARAVAQERESVRRMEAPEPKTELGKELKQQMGMPTSLVDKYIRKMGADKLKKSKPKQPRLGQATFRIAVLDAYGRACAVTGEHSLPALEASHICSYDQDGPHETRNGLLLRADLHRLFDKGYLTVTLDLRLEVSARLREEYDNGRSYYPLQGARLQVPSAASDRPEKRFLEWHHEHVFRV